MTYVTSHELLHSLRVFLQDLSICRNLFKPFILFFLVQSMQLHQIFPQLLNILNRGKADVVSLANKHRLLVPIAIQSFQHRLIIKRIMQQLIDDFLIS